MYRVRCCGVSGGDVFVVMSVAGVEAARSRGNVIGLDPRPPGPVKISADITSTHVVVNATPVPLRIV
jgi:hypothetical protein